MLSSEEWKRWNLGYRCQKGIKESKESTTPQVLEAIQSTLDFVKFYCTKSKNWTISNSAKMDNFQNLVENQPFYELDCTIQMIILISSM